MSLLWNRGRIARAVAGTLPPAAEQRLRAHLRGCDGCRARYDELARAAAALAAAGGRDEGAQAAARARARLVAALPEAGATAGAEARARHAAGGGVSSRWSQARALAPTGALAAAIALLVVGRPAPPTPGPGGGGGDGVQLRGAPAGAPAEGTRTEVAAGTLLVYAAASQPGGTAGAPRLVAELPGSGEGRASLSEYLAFGVRDLRGPVYVTVLGIEDRPGDAGVHLYLPRAGEPSRAGASTGPVVFRLGIDLASSHQPGRLRVYALFTSTPLAASAVLEVAARVDRAAPGAPALELPVPQVSGVLMVGP